MNLTNRLPPAANLAQNLTQWYKDQSASYEVKQAHEQAEQAQKSRDRCDSLIDRFTDTLRSLQSLDNSPDDYDPTPGNVLSAYGRLRQRDDGSYEVNQISYNSDPEPEPISMYGYILTPDTNTLTCFESNNKTWLERIANPDIGETKIDLSSETIVSEAHTSWRWFEAIHSYFLSDDLKDYRKRAYAMEKDKASREKSLGL